MPEDKLWCPVRALKWYLSRTKHLRGECKQLLITSIPPHRAASKDTIALWIVQPNKAASTDAWPTPLDIPVHAHEVRGMVASWAFFKGVPINEIIQAACWKTSSTFTSCYLKDVLQQDGATGRAALAAPRPTADREDKPAGSQ